MDRGISWLVDRNGDGIADDLDVRFTLPPGDLDRDLVCRAVDFAASLGLTANALPFPVCLVVGSSDGDVTQLDLTSIDYSPEMQVGDHGSTDASEPPAPCLTSLFTIDGALADLDGDQLPDSTSIRFELPDQIPAEVAAALVNLGARIGLESGGLAGSLCEAGGVPFRIRLDGGEPRLAAVDDGWLASGDAAGLAKLLDLVASDWPYAGHPASGGVVTALRDVRRSLAGVAAPAQLGPLGWGLQWSAVSEVERLLEACRTAIIPALRPGEAARLTVFACEPPQERRQLAARLRHMLDAAGIPLAELQVLSAFKVGLSWLREVVLPEAADRNAAKLEVRYPRHHPGDDGLDLPIRWLQELFPGDEVAAKTLGIELDQIPLIEVEPAGALAYEALAFDRSGNRIGSWECPILHANWPFLAPLADAGSVAVTTGGFVVHQGRMVLRIPIETDLERFWRFWQSEVCPRLLAAVDAAGGPAIENQPFFGRLDIEVTLSAPNEAVGIRQENDSAAEALHEDIYFNALDLIEVHGLRTTGEKTSAPGAIVPTVRVEPGATPHARVRLWSTPERAERIAVELWVSELRLASDGLVPRVVVDTDQIEACRDRLAAWNGPNRGDRTMPVGMALGDDVIPVQLQLPELLTSEVEPRSAPPARVNLYGGSVLAEARNLTAFPEVSGWVEATSTGGRPVLAIALTAPTPGRLAPPVKASILKPTALIVARHHANEISSTNAALTLAWKCGTDPEWRDLLKHVNVVVLPFENPDGAALHAQLSSDSAATEWKHHPARYNLHGAEFSEYFHDPESPFGEALARPALWRRWLPDAIVDNHGVPSHEWVQPFGGFGSPLRFRVSYWIPQALIYGIVSALDDPAHQRAADLLVERVSRAFEDTKIGDLNVEIGRSYRAWGQERVPDRFPGEFVRGMLWHRATVEADPEARSFAVRYPQTTLLSWVTEVNDETATGDHLAMVAEAHLLANRAMLDLLAGSFPDDKGSDRPARGIGRERPLRDRVWKGIS